MRPIMKSSLTRTGLLAMMMTGLMATGGQAAGLLTPKNAGYQDLKIVDHTVSVVIEDGYAITTIEQVFANPNAVDLEAVYSFPVPEKAAVSQFTYWIDGKPISGEVLEKKAAREIYEREKKAGRETALTEQDNHVSFDISVWPVQAGQDVRIKLGYIQPAHMETGIGRYNYPLEEGGVDDSKLSFWNSNDEVAGRFSFDLTLRSAYPIDRLRLPAHPQAQITRINDQEWQVHMDNGIQLAQLEGEGLRPVTGEAETGIQANSFKLDTDIITYWRHKPGLPGSIDLIAHKEGEDGRGTFMLVATPGDDLKQITEGRDWVFLLDKSGSMQGKFQSLLEGVRQGLGQLPHKDRFRVILFDEGVRELTNGYQPVDEAAVRSILLKLDQVTPGNGTNLYAGIRTAIRDLESDRTTGVILVTDGVANVGEIRKKAFLKLVKDRDVRLFTMMMGNGADRPLLEQISKESGGTAQSLSNSDDILGAIMTATGKLGHEAMHDVVVSVDGVKVRDLWPQRIGSLYRGEQLVLFGHYWKGGPADVTIEARISGEKKQYQTKFDFPHTATRNPEVERLWAFAAIEDLIWEQQAFGEDEDRKQAVIDLAVENGLVTPYTSMLVVRDDRFDDYNIQRTNNDRTNKEQAAAQARANGQVASNRVDTKKPAFQTPRPSHNNKKTTVRRSGGGGASSLDGIWVLMFAFLMLALMSRKAVPASKQESE